MATTTNYGWTTPDNTALVKDGASAIRTLGSSIDTTLKAQIDAQIPDSLLTTKGDLIAATGASTPARLAVGSNDQVLIADSTAATGIKWGTPSSGGMTSLATGTLSSTSATISSISQAYTDLLLVINNPYVTTGSHSLTLRVNGVSTATYTGSLLLGGTGGSATDRYSANSSLYFNAAGMVLPTSSSTQQYTLYIPAYTFAGYHSYQATSSGSNTTYGAIFGTHWSPTVDAVTSLEIRTQSGGTFGGGTYTLYGVK
jgi:hypothetical protein